MTQEGDNHGMSHVLFKYKNVKGVPSYSPSYSPAYIEAIAGKDLGLIGKNEVVTNMSNVTVSEGGK